MVKQQKSRFTGYLFRLCIIVIIVLAFLVVTHFIRRSTEPKVSPIPHQTIHQLPPSPAANNGEKKLTSSSAINQGTATDNHGTSSISTSPSQWNISQSGVITVKQPASNARIKSGDSISGSASVAEVQFRLIDNTVGVISQGPISVVNGQFSASISFKSYGTSGRLDVFSTDPSNGREVNEVQIPVTF